MEAPADTPVGDTSPLHKSRGLLRASQPQMTWGVQCIRRKEEPRILELRGTLGTLGGCTHTHTRAHPYTPFLTSFQKLPAVLSIDPTLTCRIGPPPTSPSRRPHPTGFLAFQTPCSLVPPMQPAGAWHLHVLGPPPALLPPLPHIPSPPPLRSPPLQALPDHQPAPGPSGSNSIALAAPSRLSSCIHLFAYSLSC